MHTDTTSVTVSHYYLCDLLCNGMVMLVVFRTTSLKLTLQFCTSQQHVNGTRLITLFAKHSRFLPTQFIYYSDKLDIIIMKSLLLLHLFLFLLSGC